MPYIAFYTLSQTRIRCNYQEEFCQQSASNSPKKWQVHAGHTDNRQQRTDRYDCLSDTSAFQTYNLLLHVPPDSFGGKKLDIELAGLPPEWS